MGPDPGARSVGGRAKVLGGLGVAEFITELVDGLLVRGGRRGSLRHEFGRAVIEPTLFELFRSLCKARGIAILARRFRSVGLRSTSTQPEVPSNGASRYRGGAHAISLGQNVRHPARWRSFS